MMPFLRHHFSFYYLFCLKILYTQVNHGEGLWSVKIICKSDTHVTSNPSQIFPQLTLELKYDIWLDGLNYCISMKIAMRC